MEASTLTHASRGGLLGRRSPLLKLQGDERLVAMIRGGHERAFEVLFERYNSRLLAFCRHMLRSTEDAEDVLQEVFVKAHGAMLADERPINVRPWLYRIARNRCLNHLRKPVPDGQDSMDVMVGENGVTTADRVQKREDFRALVADVQDLPETQRTALLLRELDALSYEEIAVAMDTTVPAVKSLLVRARMSLAEATHSRQLTCGEVRLELAEAAEGLRKATGPARHHIKRCDPCRAYRTELRSNTKALASLAPIGPLALIHHFLIGKLSGGGGGTAAGGSAVAGGTAAGTGAVATAGAGAGTGAGAAVAGGGGGVFAGGTAAAGGVGGAIGAKAAATAATAALLTAGAVEVRSIYGDRPVDIAAKKAVVSKPPARRSGGLAAEPPTIDVVATSATAVPAIEQAVEPGPTEETAASEQATTPAEEPKLAAAPLADELAAAPPTLVDQLQQGVVGPPAASDSVVGDPEGGAGGSAVVAQPTPASPPASSTPPPSQPPASGESSTTPAHPTPVEAAPEPATPAADPVTPAPGPPPAS